MCGEAAVVVRRDKAFAACIVSFVDNDFRKRSVFCGGVATKILQVVEDSALRERLLAEGGKVLAALPSPQEKYEQLVVYMREIVGSGG